MPQALHFSRKLFRTAKGPIPEDDFPRPGEVVLWDGAFGSTEKFPAKVQSLRHARGSLFEGAGKTVRF